MKTSDDGGPAVRALAARLNARVVAGAESLNAVKAAGDTLAQRDRRLLRALLSNSLRWHHRFDWFVGQLLDRPLRRDAELLGALLRVGLTQLSVLRVPDHAAVATTVEATAELGLSRARGLVNAVLRRYLRDRDILEDQLRGNDVAFYSHPLWLIDALKHDWPGDWARILNANNEPPPLWLRVNRRLVSRQDYLDRLAAEGIAAEGPESLPDAILVAKPRPVADIPGFSAGQVSVQDAAAQKAVDLMQLAPGVRVLDACAAPGGKTAHMLERCPGIAELVAVDRDAARLAQVGENLDRLGLTAVLVEGDAADPAGWTDGRPFDRILADAPCSATGVIRRNPDIKVLRRADDVPRMAAQQARIVRSLWPLLAPGGRMIYATCSVLTDENSGLIERVCGGRDPDAITAVRGSVTQFQILPGETNMDGFYYACLPKGSGR